MNNQLKYKYGFIAAVVVACLIGIFCVDQNGLKFPTSLAQLRQNISDRIQLGLDLKGGSHLVLQVQLQEAIGQHTDQAIDVIKQQARTNNINLGEVRRVSDTQIEVHDVDPNRVSTFPRHAYQPADGVDQQPPGRRDRTAICSRFRPPRSRRCGSKRMEQGARDDHDARRINALGLTEPTIAFTGCSDDEILVQLPGEGDPSCAKAAFPPAANCSYDVAGGCPTVYQSQAEAPGLRTRRVAGGNNGRHAEAATKTLAGSQPSAV